MRRIRWCSTTRRAWWRSGKVRVAQDAGVRDGGRPAAGWPGPAHERPADDVPGSAGRAAAVRAAQGLRAGRDVRTAGGCVIRRTGAGSCTVAQSDDQQHALARVRTRQAREPRRAGRPGRAARRVAARVARAGRAPPASTCPASRSGAPRGCACATASRCRARRAMRSPRARARSTCTAIDDAFARSGGVMGRVHTTPVHRGVRRLRPGADRLLSQFPALDGCGVAPLLPRRGRAVVARDGGGARASSARRSSTCPCSSCGPRRTATRSRSTRRSSSGAARASCCRTASAAAPTCWWKGARCASSRGGIRTIRRASRPCRAPVDVRAWCDADRRRRVDAMDD